MFVLGCRFEEGDVVMMHSLLSVCGFHLRSEDPAALKARRWSCYCSHKHAICYCTHKHAMGTLQETHKATNTAFLSLRESL